MPSSLSARIAFGPALEGYELSVRVSVQVLTEGHASAYFAKSLLGERE